LRIEYTPRPDGALGVPPAGYHRFVSPRQSRDTPSRLVRGGGIAPAGWLCLLLMVCGCASREALLVLSDIGAGTGESRLKKSTPVPSRTPVAFTVSGRAGAGDLYLPRQGPPRAALVLVPGAVPEGKDHEQLVAFATTLARARFAVLTPELSGYQQLKMRPAHVRELADAFLYLADREDLGHGGRVGFGAFSYAVGPAVLAALEDDTREKVRFVLGVGGYHDLRVAIGFFTTGFFEEDGKPRRLEPNEYGKLVFARSVTEHLRSASDRATIDAMVDAALADPAADLSVLARGLGPEGRAVYRLIMNTDPLQTPRLIDALPPGARATIDALTLAGKHLERLRARLILVHGRDDRLIPFPETLALARSVPSDQARVIILNRILGHVDLRFSSALSWRFWTEELPDGVRLARAVDLLLRERDVAAPGAAARTTQPQRASNVPVPRLDRSYAVAGKTARFATASSGAEAQ
jgi:hypothetical protein